MARRTNYNQEKRLKELERQKKKEKKKVRKFERDQQASSQGETAKPEGEGTGNFHESE